MKRLNNLKNKLLRNHLFRDSIWAVGGNGIGNALLLISGIIIAHFLGKIEYGEYGLIKTTMFFMASFASFGLNYTSTKFVSSALTKKTERVLSYITNAITITCISSLSMAILTCAFAWPLAKFLNEPSLTTPIRLLGILIIVRALIYSYTAIIAGFGDFKALAKNNVLSGVVMLILAIPSTLYCGLFGALGCLIISQVTYLFLQYRVARQLYRNLPVQSKVKVSKEMLRESLPVALHEATYAVCNWTGTILITKLSSLGELGLYTAAAQWNAIILFIPNILVNVIVSNLSKVLDNKKQHDKILKITLIANFICAAVPFLFVLLCSKYIAALYGSSFTGLTPVINTMIFATIFICCSNVFYSEFIANGKTLVVFIGRLLRDGILIGLGYCLIKYWNPRHAAFDYGLSTIVASIFHLLFLATCYYIYSKHTSKTIAE